MSENTPSLASISLIILFESSGFLKLRTIDFLTSGITE